MSSRVKACLRCRRKKIKCDMARPACDQCRKASLEDDCIYGEESKFHTMQLLEDRISQLIERIAFLEGNMSGPIYLHDPYAPFHERQTPRETDASQRVLPPATREALLLAFSRGASQAGFFMHAQRFCQRAFAMPQSTHPSPLLNAAYLLGSHLSDSDDLRCLESHLLERTLQDLSANLVDPSPSALLDVIQAEVLLANYFFSGSRLVEAVYHMDAAAALVLTSGLDEVQTLQGEASVDGSAPRYQLPPASDYIEQQERDNAFFATLVLDACWSAVLARTPVLANKIESSSAITPTLTALADPTFTSIEQDPLALHAKAAMLYNSATRVAAESATNASTYALRSADIYHRLLKFRQSLQPIEHVEPRREDLVSRMLLVHLLVICAIIQIREPLDLRETVIAMDSGTVLAAYDAVSMLAHVNTGGIAFVDPIVGFLLASIVGVLVKALRSTDCSHFGPAPVTPGEDFLWIALGQICTVLETWARPNAYLRYQHSVVLTMIGQI